MIGMLSASVRSDKRVSWSSTIESGMGRIGSGGWCILGIWSKPNSVPAGRDRGEGPVKVI